MSNSDNPYYGSEFQRQVKEWFIVHYNQNFKEEVKIKIGSPLTDPTEYKEHKFDIVSEDNSVAIECKRYTWTETWNVPSAKMRGVNEAILYLSLLPSNFKKYLVMIAAYNPKRHEYLADYYYKTNKHLLGDIVIAEYNPNNDGMRMLNKSTNS